VDMGYTWHDYWGKGTHRYKLIGLTILFYTLCGVIITFAAFFIDVGKSDCIRTLVVVVVTGSMCLIFTIISALDVIERGSVFISSLLSLDSMLLLMKILAVETTNCNVLNYYLSSTTVIICTTFIIGFIGIGYSSLYYFVAPRTVDNATPPPRRLRTTNSYGVVSHDSGFPSTLSDMMRPRRDSVILDLTDSVLNDKRAYNYSKYHAVFTFGCMYLGTSFTTIVGSPVMFWLIFSVMCVVFIIYIWTLLAPLFFRKLRLPNKDSPKFPLPDKSISIQEKMVDRGVLLPENFIIGESDELLVNT